MYVPAAHTASYGKQQRKTSDGWSDDWPNLTFIILDKSDGPHIYTDMPAAMILLSKTYNF